MISENQQLLQHRPRSSVQVAKIDFAKSIRNFKHHLSLVHLSRLELRPPLPDVPFAKFSISKSLFLKVKFQLIVDSDFSDEDYEKTLISNKAKKSEKEKFTYKQMVQ